MARRGSTRSWKLAPPCASSSAARSKRQSGGSGDAVRGAAEAAPDPPAEAASLAAGGERRQSRRPSTRSGIDPRRNTSPQRAQDWQIPSGQITNGFPPEAGESQAPMREILDPLLPSEPPAQAAAPFPGDEPTLVEGVSAALIDKLRERDAEQQPAPEANVTMQDFSLAGVEEADPDEAHWRETYDRFRELKLQLGEPADRLSFEKFAAKLKKNRTDLLAKHNCKGVRFSVYEKDGRAAIKASAIR